MKKYEDEIRNLSTTGTIDPVKDLIRNSSVTNFFYSLEEISGHGIGCSLWENQSPWPYIMYVALHLKKGSLTIKIEELVENATYGGELRIYFNAMFDRLISKDPENDFKKHPFTPNNGGYCRQPEWFRHHARIPLDITFPFSEGRIVCRFTGATILCQ